MRKLSVMVSSTFYDLKHVRDELHGHILSLGHEPILSEKSSFSVDPSRTTIENCMDAVSSEADILILIVGQRYGSTVPGGKSVTNLEYEAARVKGIPIYVFIDQKIIDLLPLVESNESLNVPGVDDSGKLFEFVKTLQQRHQVWCFPFNNVSDITSVMSSQLSKLFLSSLSLRRLLHDPASDWMRSLSPRLAYLLISQDFAFEHRFLLEASLEAIQVHRAKRWLVCHDIAFQPTFEIGDSTMSVTSWITNKLSEISAKMVICDRLFNSALAEALRPDGTPADPYELFVTAQAFGAFYESLLEIAGEISLVVLPESIEEVRPFLKGAVLSIITDIEVFFPTALKDLDTAHSRFAAGERNFVLPLTCRITNYFGPRKAELDSVFEKLRMLG